MKELSFLFLSANTPWVYALAEALAVNYPIYATQSYDWLNYFRLHPSWSNSTAPTLIQRTMQVLPPGYAGSFEPIFRPYLQSLIQRWCRTLQNSTGEHPWVVAPYPYLASWVRKVPSQKLIYYNFDDYVLYQPSRKKRILYLEQELVERATLTLCASQFQVEALQKRHPLQAERIHYYSHGVVDSYINPDLEKPPEPMTVGYVGNLIDRVDWQLVYQVAQACPEITFIFVGGLKGFVGGSHKDNWQVERDRALTLPNVRHISEVPQADVKQYYWSFALNWIPYSVVHPFNQASCPTKVMDTIATGRPVLSTDIPECRLYPEWITIFHSAKEAVSLIRQQLNGYKTTQSQQKSLQQLEFAVHNTWQVRAQALEKLLLS